MICPKCGNGVSRLWKFIRDADASGICDMCWIIKVQKVYTTDSSLEIEVKFQAIC